MIDTIAAIRETAMRRKIPVAAMSLGVGLVATAVLVDADGNLRVPADYRAAYQFLGT